ncbi:MAG: threonine ammonia-lyase [Lautropia sp.]
MLTIEDIRAAADRLRGHVLDTPCLLSRTLSDITGAEVWLKFENLQFTASFKERGALNRIATLTGAERGRGVITASAGNHAQGVAYHARRLGIRAVIVMPRLTPAVKVARTRGFGAEIILHGDGFDEARDHAEALAAERGLTMVHPFDDVAVMAGQGTIGLEILATAPDLDALVVGVGGGGLSAGIAVAARALKPELQLFGVQTARYPGAWNAFHGRSREGAPGTIAEGIAVAKPGRLTMPVLQAMLDDLVLVEEARIEEAILMLLEVEKTVVEGAGAVGLAALLAERERFAGKRVGLVLSGGNIDPRLLAGLIDRGLVRSGRLARIHIELRDIPGALAHLTALLGELQANIEEVHHQRAFSNMPLQNADVEVVIQTRGPEHVADVLARLGAEGYRILGGG